MKLLITGVAGFVGSSIARYFLSLYSDIEITGIDNFSFGYRERLVDFVEDIAFHEFDVLEINSRLEPSKYDCIVHCAAIAPLPECQINHTRALQQNVSMCGSVIDYAVRSDSRCIVFMSSGAVYENQTIYPSDESQVIRTSLVYPTTKHLAEIYLESVTRSYPLHIYALRLFNLYGPHQDYFRKQPPLIGYLLKSLLLNQVPTLYGDGSQRRDYVYIDDLAELIDSCLRDYSASSVVDSGRFEAINAGSGVTVSVNEIIDILNSISSQSLNRIKRGAPNSYWHKYKDDFRSSVQMSPGLLDAEVNKFTQADTEKAFRELKWKAKVDINAGLIKCYTYAVEYFNSLA